MGGGTTKTTSTVNIPPKSEEELALMRTQNEVLQLQLAEIKRQNDALAEVFPKQKQLLAAQTESSLLQAKFFSQMLKEFEQKPLAEQTPEEREITAQNKEIDELSRKRALATLRGEALPVSPQQEEQINKLYKAAQEEVTRNVRQFSEESASARGLRQTDTPIAKEATEAIARGTAGLESAKAGAKLNFGQSQQAFAEGTRQFQEGLKQMAVQNRLALLGRPSMQPALGTGQAGNLFAAITPALEMMGNQRLAAATRTSTSSYSPGLFDYFQVAAQTAGAAAGAFAASSIRLKKDVTPYDPDEYDAALEKLKATPITRWRYKWESKDHPLHTGPILELSPPDIKEDAYHLNLLNYTGLVHAGVKALDRKVERVRAMIADSAKAA